MSKNEEKEQTSIHRPFFIASDEGDVWSEDIHSIYKADDSTTHLRRRHGDTAYVKAPQNVVRQIFREHGYDIIDEKELQQRVEDYKADKHKPPEPA